MYSIEKTEQKTLVFKYLLCSAISLLISSVKDREEQRKFVFTTIVHSDTYHTQLDCFVSFLQKDIAGCPANHLILLEI